MPGRILPLAPADREAGMTLIEVMAVVFIIGLTSTLVLFTVPDRQLPERQMVRTVQAQIEQIREEAVLVGAPRGLDLHEDGTLVTYAYRRAQWQPIQTLASESSGLELRVRGGTQSPQAAQSQPNRTEQQRPPAPRFVAEPIGVSSTLEVEIVGRTERYVLNVGEDGAVHVAEQ